MKEIDKLGMIESFVQWQTDQYVCIVDMECVIYWFESSAPSCVKLPKASFYFVIISFLVVLAFGLFIFSSHPSEAQVVKLSFLLCYYYYSFAHVWYVTLCYYLLYCLKKKFPQAVFPARTFNVSYAKIDQIYSDMSPVTTIKLYQLKVFWFYSVFDIFSGPLSSIFICKPYQHSRSNSQRNIFEQHHSRGSNKKVKVVFNLEFQATFTNWKGTKCSASILDPFV